MERAVIRAWNEYWFSPGRLLDLAALRLALVASELVLYFPTLSGQLAMSRQTGHQFVALPALKVLLLPFAPWGSRPSHELLIVVWSVGVCAGVFALIGVLGRPALFLFAWSTTVLNAHSYSYGSVHHPEAVIVIMLWLLVLSPSYHALSIQAVRLRLKAAVASMHFTPVRDVAPRTDQFALWPLRVAQWLVCLIYLSAAVSKFWNGGVGWYYPSTLRYYLVDDGMNQSRHMGLLLASHPGVLSVLAVLTGIIELFFILVMFVPVLTWLFVPLGAAMHIGVFATQGVNFLQYIFVYVAFAEPMRRSWPTVARLARRAGLWISWNAPPPLTVVYDGLCPLCTRTMVFLDLLDMSHRLEYVDLERSWPAVTQVAPALTPDAARSAIHVVNTRGDVFRGYFAFKRLSRELPALWLSALALALPGADLLGVRIYDLVARRRSRLSCDTGGCTAHQVIARGGIRSAR